VFANGCFDVLHAGHLCLLEQARQAARRLIVAVNSDEYCRRVKGARRPIQSAAVRQRVVAGVSEADVVLTWAELTPERLLELIRPDVYVIGSDYRSRSLPGADWCGRIEFVERLAGFSTTATVKRLQAG
jgi:D-beta-D-heptose 7-phosphate kinase/D-beta-D-heptose 1-phosphate adenosyltransferase